MLSKQNHGRLDTKKDSVGLVYKRNADMRNTVTIFVASLGLSNALIMAVKNYAADVPKEFFGNVIIAVLLAGALAGFKQYPMSKKPAFMLTYASVFYFIWLFATGVGNGYGALWSLIIPVFSFYIRGLKEGVLISLCALLLLVGICGVDLFFSPVFFQYQFDFISRFFLIYVMIFVVSAVYEAGKKRMESVLEENACRAQDANDAKTTFLANMSHEIRTPLNGIIGFTDLLKETPLTPLQLEYVTIVNQSGHTLLDIVNDILDLSKIEAGKMEIEVIKTDMVKLLKDSVDIIRFAAGKKSLEVLLNIESAMPRFAKVDPFRLKQILTNLLGNAVKFTEKGEVELKVGYENLENSQGRFTFFIRDTGIGITEEQKQKLFKVFSQADSSTTRKFGGTGLGLVISDMIAQKMGCKIEFNSSHGKGSTFYFNLIATVEEEQKENASESIGTSCSRLSNTSLKILIAEDVTVNMLVIASLVKRIVPQAEIIEVNNGLQALEYCKKNQVDLILMDVQMPQMDGLKTTEMIRLQQRGVSRHTPIIGQTAGALEEQKERCLAAGMDDFITKPIDYKTLEACLEKYL